MFALGPEASRLSRVNIIPLYEDKRVEVSFVQISGNYLTLILSNTNLMYHSEYILCINGELVWNINLVRVWDMTARTVEIYRPVPADIDEVRFGFIIKSE